MLNPLTVILIALALAYLLGEISRKLNLPRVVGQISAGLILGIPLIKENIFSADHIEIFFFLANLGIVLLFYYIGLETNINLFIKNVKLPITISLLNKSIPLLFGFFISKFYYGFSTLVSLIIGISLGMSAISISMEVLEELKLLRSKIGRLMIASGAVGDVLELFMLGLFFSVFNVSETGFTFTEFLIEIGIFMIIIAASRIWLLPYTLGLFDREKSSTARFTGALLLVLFIASLAEFLGIGLLVGSLIAGLLVRQTIFKEVTIPNWEEHDISRSIHIIAFGFLIPLFFVSVGLNVDFSLFAQNFWFIIILAIIAILGISGGTVLAVMLNGGKFRDGILLGWGLNSKGDVNLAIASLALSGGIITDSVYTSLVIMTLITTIISPIVFNRMIFNELAAKKKSTGQT